jgi:hypothetical protein
VSDLRVSPLIVVAAFVLLSGVAWREDESSKTDAAILEQVEAINQRQCVKDVHAAGTGPEFASSVALNYLSTAWSASEQLAAHQSALRGDAGYLARAGENWLGNNWFYSGSIAPPLAGYSVATLITSWGISAAKAGADTCGRATEAHEIEDRLSPLKAPIERRNAMRTYAAELVDGLGGMGRLQADQLAVATKILGPDYPRVIAGK